MYNYLGFDLGTGAVKAVCWSPSRGLLARLSERLVFSSSTASCYEYDAEAHFSLVLGMMRRLAEQAEAPIAGLAFAAASGNTLICDQQGRPLTAVISWLDQRLPWQPPDDWQVRQVTGWPGIPSFPLMHLQWFKENNPALLQGSCIGMNNDFLQWRLCGRRVLDHSSATPFYLQEQSQRRWHKPFLQYYGISEEQLPQLLAPGSKIAVLKEEYWHAKLGQECFLYAGSFDHPAAARASNISKPDEMLLSCGTSWVGLYPVRRRQDVPMQELCDPFQSAHGACWAGMFSVSGIGLEIEDFILQRYGKCAQRYEQFNQEALSPDNAAAALMQDVCRRFADKLGARRPRRIVMCGGPAEGKAWPIILQKTLQLPIQTSPYQSYAGALGAAMLAAAKTV